MSPINCKLIIYSNSMHLAQLFTGFENIQKAGLIKVKIEDSKLDKYKKGLGLPILKLIIDDRYTVLFDTDDPHYLIQDNLILRDVDFYFKRSFIKGGYSSSDLSFKVYPLGFNYAVYGKNNFIFQRLFSEKGWKKKIEILARNNYYLGAFFRLNTSSWNCLDSKINIPPNFNYAKQQILFMTRIWPEERARNQEIKEKRQHLNYFRTEIIRQLKKEFKENFFGGLFIDGFSKKQYPDCLLPSNEVAKKNNYFKLLKDFPICITSNGKYAAGWSVGEYISFSKAIVADKINDDIPGDFINGKNYFEFETVEQCIKACNYLMERPDICFQMAVENYRYYHSYLKPESMIINVLNTVLSDTKV